MRLKFRKTFRLAFGVSLLAVASLMGMNTQSAKAATVTLIELYPNTSTIIGGPTAAFTIDYSSGSSNPFGGGRPWTFRDRKSVV